MARVTMGQTKEYSLPDQVKVNTDEKEKKFLEENTKTKKGTRKKTRGEKINQMLKDSQKREYDAALTRDQREYEASKLKKGGRVKKKNTRRMNRLEELGRVDAEKAYTRKGKRNLRSEKKRIVRELKSNGGSAGAAIRGKGCEIR